MKYRIKKTDYGTSISYTPEVLVKNKWLTIGFAFGGKRLETLPSSAGNEWPTIHDATDQIDRFTAQECNPVINKEKIDYIPYEPK